MKAGLPRLDGALGLTGLSAPVTVERDALGVATLRGVERLDVARATGFLHAQERFFQMDLSRRQAAGELAALLGGGAVRMDERMRKHRFRTRAQDALAASSADERALIEAYTAGVNAGLVDLGAPPFEYLLLRTDPAPWTPEDSYLVIYAMYVFLQDPTGDIETTYGQMWDVLPPELFRFLTPAGTPWDAPLQGEAYASPPIPGPESFSLRGDAPTRADDAPADDADTPNAEDQELAPGSNSWVVAGHRTRHGGAILANDMHLRLGVPNTWFRLSLVYEEPEPRRLDGVSLPGTPLIVVGSNGHVAWGLTNTQGDWSDWVLLETPPGDEDHYLTPDGPEPFVHLLETIEIKGGDVTELEVEETRWGPVLDRDHQGRRRAFRWVAHAPGAANFSLLALEGARTVEEAMAIANRAGAPAQNFQVADRQGHIGWTVMGPVPVRFGHSGKVPTSWASGERGWRGRLAPDDYPRILDPPDGQLWTANNRVVDGEDLLHLADGGYILGARARQIRDRLSALEQADEADMLAIQLDDEALFLAPWRRLLTNLLTDERAAGKPRRGELQRIVRDWDGHASIDSGGYLLVHDFRQQVGERALLPLTTAVQELDETFEISYMDQWEGPLWRLIEERPAHLLGPAYATWDDLLLAAADAVIEMHTANGGELAEAVWGDQNISRISHSLSFFLPGSGRFLNMPRIPLAGDANMPRVQRPSFGASERLAVSPGREGEGYFHMPGGQSGHPLSPHYRDGHDAWVRGEATPFLPGEPLHTLTLQPESGMPTSGD